MNRNVQDSWPEIAPYLDEVLDLEPQEREIWLSDARERTPALAAVVDAWLHELDDLKSRDFMEIPVSARFTNTTLAGQRFGAYTLDRAIGHGGMGTVWLAHRSDGQFEGEAAVKILNTALVGHPSQQRFAREGSVLAKLQHPNIARLLDAGVAASGQPYLILEHVRGQPIDRYCESQRLDVRARLRLFLDVLAAVAHAHTHLIVHRDLKPSNILVTEKGVPKLLDFGVATLLTASAQSGSESGTEPTRPRVSAMTPAYAAPEQLLGEPVTVAADVYALGVLLYSLLAGEHPTAAQAKTPAELIRLTLEVDAPRPSDAATDPATRRQLRGDLDNIVMMALRKNPSERYSSVEHFAEDLRRYLAFEPVAARPRSFAYVARMFVRRHRVAVAAAIAMLAVLIAAIAITTKEMVDARYQRDQARYHAHRADASVEFLGELLRADPGSSGAPRSYRDRLELGVEMLDTQFGGDPQFAGRMFVDLGDYYRRDGNRVRANELYTHAYEMGKRHQDVELIALAQCSRALGDAYAGAYEGTAQRIAEAQQVLARAPAADASLSVMCLVAQANVERGQGNDASAETLLRQGLAILDDVEGDKPGVTHGALLTQLAAIHAYRQEPATALSLMQQASVIYERNGRGALRPGLMARQWSAFLLSTMGEIRPALADSEFIAGRVDSNSSPRYSTLHASLLLRMAKPAEALERLDGVVDQARRSGDSYSLASALLTVGSTFTRLGRWKDAAGALGEAQSIGLEGDPDSKTMLEALQLELALEQGDLESARRYGERALESAGHGTPDEQPSLARVLLLAARLALAQGDPRRAEALARESLGLSQAVARGAETSADVGEALLWIVRARVATDDGRGRTGEQERSMLERAVRCLTSALDAQHPLTVSARELLADLQA